MRGLYAAVPTPIHNDGRFDEVTFDLILDMVVRAGVHGVCVGGATGEYPHFDVEHRQTVIRRAAKRLPDQQVLLAGIGASSMPHVIELGRTAFDAGARAVLLPMPWFFRYEQEDLQTYARHISRTLGAPCLLYDLPDFTNGLSPETVMTLLSEEEHIVGIKDSSGRRQNLATFADARGDLGRGIRGLHGPTVPRGWTLLVGDDRLLHAGLHAGWDGGISGVAAFCPELVVAIYRSVERAEPEETARLQALLDELITQISVFPTPWGIRFGLAARGLDTGPLPLPPSEHRKIQAQEFQNWFTRWLAGSGLV
jgi:4-hydroxy-tetrahydrodipicolinate synthase